MWYHVILISLWLHLVWSLPGPSMLLWMALFHSFLWLTLCCVCGPRRLHPFTCWWTLRSLPWLGYCKQWCCEHRAACVFLNQHFVWVCARERGCWTICWPEALHTVFTVAAPTYTPTHSAGGFPFSTSPPAFITSRIFDKGHFDWFEVIPHCDFDLHFSNN